LVGVWVGAFVRGGGLCVLFFFFWDATLFVLCFLFLWVRFLFFDNPSNYHT
jgi:hypothetical protein